MTRSVACVPNRGVAYCETPDCLKKAEKGGRCATCRKALQQGRRATAEHREKLSVRGYVLEAAIALANAGDDDQDFHRAFERLRKAVIPWVLPSLLSRDAQRALAKRQRKVVRAVPEEF